MGVDEATRRWRAADSAPWRYLGNFGFRRNCYEPTLGGVAQECVECEKQVEVGRRLSEDSESDEDQGNPQLPDAGLRPGSGPNFRASFFRRLSYEGVYVPPAKRAPRHRTLIVLDWDDTLLCTSYLCSQDFSPCGSQHLRSAAAAARRLLETARQLGQTFIITNAIQGWVEHSAARFAPELLPLLKDIPVMSARHQYEPRYPSPSEWKQQAFLELHSRLDPEAITNFVAIGDSMFEIAAARSIGRIFSQAIVKTVKFRESPKPDELIKELNLARQQLPRIVECGRGLDVVVARKKGGPEQTA